MHRVRVVIPGNTWDAPDSACPRTMTGFAGSISDGNKLRHHRDPPFTSRFREALRLVNSFFEITSGTNVQRERARETHFDLLVDVLANSSCNLSRSPRSSVQWEGTMGTRGTRGWCLWLGVQSSRHTGAKGERLEGKAPGTKTQEMLTRKEKKGGSPAFL